MKVLPNINRCGVSYNRDGVWAMKRDCVFINHHGASTLTNRVSFYCDNPQNERWLITEIAAPTETQGPGTDIPIHCDCPLDDAEEV